MENSHEIFLRHCLDLAQKARGKTGINPMVGAVLVRPAGRTRMENGKWKMENEIILSEGYHEGFGKAHAERQLLEKFDPTSPSPLRQGFEGQAGLRGAGQKIRSNDILYVNLEPCVHERKKTPPCAQLLVKKGVKHIVCGMVDPNPEVSGKGIELLRSEGVEVTVFPWLAADCLRLNRGFVSLQTKGRPWITLKEAVTADHKHAKDDGSRLRITTPEQDEWSHRFLRARHDAILVGIGTVLADDPELNVRFMDDPPDIYRIILDPQLKMPLTAKIVNGKLASGTIVIAAQGFDRKKAKKLEGRGVVIHEIALTEGIFDWENLWKNLTTPKDDFHGISSILVEGGERTWDLFRSARMVDGEVTLIGG